MRKGRREPPMLPILFGTYSVVFGTYSVVFGTYSVVFGTCCGIDSEILHHPGLLSLTQSCLSLYPKLFTCTLLVLTLY